ncbi:hypothetical protein CGSSa00_08360 [Staphylococcus aureus subsp. aureus CGS00]|nr:hypothetical protein USA300HOU_1740 [Staphylococcus aureus subsp. aureus USA300_TCH1516]AFR73786.1 Hypothetical Protein C248_1796 [Staphylococcus aureus 08BA02176]EES92651.1 hypothetical protein HMPREF0776_2782 [Staphylococcus aureus subsp. aureus USA300_TCH959]EFT86597.1 hypothetical protein CGSSa03_10220 [Staphylococcus aureus subsp. aureus CGS03]EFU26050.1 hypothetical protein CGSSa00_08360 [Staphylococcus aureus subsp. aureus CGS00]EFU27558.1 hypothetical protein CGSSa01_01011 [Staphylo
MMHIIFVTHRKFYNFYHYISTENEKQNGTFY